MLPYVLVRPRQWERDPAAIREAVEALDYPVFVKPARAGSSFGISRVDAPTTSTTRSRRRSASTPRCSSRRRPSVRARSRSACSRGWTAAAPRPARSPRSRSTPEHAFYDFEAKYLEQSYRDPGLASTRTSPTQVRDARGRAFEALDVEGLARVDFFVFPDGRVVVNEVETMPGFTATSMFPLMWQASGLTYPELVDRLVQLALERGRPACAESAQLQRAS